MHCGISLLDTPHHMMPALKIFGLVITVIIMLTGCALLSSLAIDCDQHYDVCSAPTVIVIEF